MHLLIVSPMYKIFKLGRGHAAHVRVNDISISREHAFIKCRNDGFYIEDNNSKFGTLVLPKDNIYLKRNEQTLFQVGRT